MNSTTAFYLRPLTQGLIIAALDISVIAIVLVLKWLRVIVFEPMDIWLISTSMVFFYIIMSSIFCFNAIDRLKYYRESVFVYLILTIVLTGLSIITTGIDFQDAGSHSYIVYVLSIVYLVFMVIIAMIRKIVDLAIKQTNNKT